MQTVDSAKLAQAKFSFNQESFFLNSLFFYVKITLHLSKWRELRKKGNADRIFSLRKNAVFLISSTLLVLIRLI